MPIPTLIIDTIPFATPSQAWGNLSELVVSQPTWDLIPFAMPGQRWGDLSELLIAPVGVGMIPYAMPSQRWGDLVETTRAVVEEHPDPDTHPFVVEAGLIPQPGEMGFSQIEPITIPCGDRIAEEISTRVLDPFLAQTNPAEPRGLDDSGTIITVKFGDESPVTVLSGGVVAPGWSVTTAPNDQAGENRAIAGVGIDYQIQPDDPLPPRETIAVTVQLFDHGNRTSTYSYSFQTTGDPPYLFFADPSDGEIEVPRDTTFLLEFKDHYLAIDQALVVITIGGEIAWTGDAPGSGWSGTKTVLDPKYVQYNLQRLSMLPANTNIEVDYVVPNVAELTLTGNFSITTADSPTIDTNSPTGTDVPVDALIAYSTKDNGSGVDPTTIETTVNGVVAVLHGEIQPGWDGPSASITPNAFGGYDVVLDKTTDFSSYELVEVVASVKDYYLNTGALSWDFRVVNYVGPLVHPVYPTPGAMQVPTNSHIIVEVTDLHEVTVLQVRVNLGEGLVVAYRFGDTPAFKPGWDGPESAEVPIANGYRVVVDPESVLPDSAFVWIEITATDPEGNPERLG
jgi:hypothetical protein